jgi:ferredoxin
MKFKVDQEECVGCGACESTCPEVFRLENDKSQIILTPVPEEYQSIALEAEEGCPVSAISHEQKTC